MQDTEKEDFFPFKQYSVSVNIALTIREYILWNTCLRFFNLKMLFLRKLLLNHWLLSEIGLIQYYITDACNRVFIQFISFLCLRFDLSLLWRFFEKCRKLFSQSYEKHKYLSKNLILGLRFDFFFFLEKSETKFNYWYYFRFSLSMTFLFKFVYSHLISLKHISLGKNLVQRGVLVEHL